MDHWDFSPHGEQPFGCRSPFRSGKGFHVLLHIVRILVEKEAKASCWIHSEHIRWAVSWGSGQAAISRGCQQVSCPGTGRIPAVLVEQTRVPGTEQLCSLCKPTAGTQLCASLWVCTSWTWADLSQELSLLPNSSAASPLLEPQGLIPGIALFQGYTPETRAGCIPPC